MRIGLATMCDSSPERWSSGCGDAISDRLAWRLTSNNKKLCKKNHSVNTICIWKDLDRQCRYPSFKKIFFFSNVTFAPIQESQLLLRQTASHFLYRKWQPSQKQDSSTNRYDQSKIKKLFFLIQNASACKTTTTGWYPIIQNKKFYSKHLHESVTQIG